jgi:hypothetical protein
VKSILPEELHGFSACSLGLSATNQQYFSLRTNQPPATSQQYFSLRTNQHQPSAISQTNRPFHLEESAFFLKKKKLQNPPGHLDEENFKTHSYIFLVNMLKLAYVT